MAGVLTRLNDVVRGQWELGGIVDRAAPNATPEQRQKLIDFQRNGDAFRSALGNVRRYADQSWATNFKARSRASAMGFGGPKTMASDLLYVRNQVRHFAYVNPHGKNIIRALRGWVLADGINMTPRPGNKALAKKIEIYKKWFFNKNQIDANKTFGFYLKQHVVLTHLIVDGGVIVRLRFRRAKDNLVVPLAVEELPVDYFWDGPTPDIEPGNTYSNGKEFTPLGHAKAFWLYRGHPGDPLTNRTPVRVPIVDPVTGMTQITHLVDPDSVQAGMIHGESRFTAMMETGYGQRNLRLTTLNRLNAQSKILHWLQRKPGATDEEATPPLYGIEGGERFSLDTGELVPQAPTGSSQGIDPYDVIDFINGEILADNTVLPLPAGLEVKESVITTPTDYAPLMRDMHLEMSAGAGLPHEIMTGDMKGLAYSGFKAGTQTFKSSCLIMQQYIIDEYCKFVWDGFVMAGHLAGLWSETEIPCDFRANAFPSVEPQKDIGVIILKLRNGLISPRRAAAELGEDLDELIAEIAEDKTKLEEIGVDIWGALALAAKQAGASAKDAGRTDSPGTAK